MLPHEVKERIEKALTSCTCLVNEFSGGIDHYSVIVLTEDFSGKSLIARHRLVMDLFKEEIGTGEVHALSIEAFTPTEWKEKNKGV